MTTKLTMPKRRPTDGPVSVSRPTDGVIQISCTNAGDISAVAMSEYNAWRAFGMLALMLEIPLPPSIGKAIKLGADFKATLR